MAQDARSLRDPASSRFLIDTLIGEGASKRVYRARDIVLRRTVAIAFFEDAAAPMERVLAEAQAMARVSAHEGIVTIFDVTERGGALCMVTEYLSGGNLRDRLSAGSIELSLAVRIALRIAAALGFAHGRGIVHRDIKPENIIFDEQGEAYLTDFGLATFLESRSTDEGYLVGTPDYMAPEQIQGTESPLSDLYSLGCMLFEMLTGQPLFGGSASEVLHHHLCTRPRSPKQINPTVPPAISRLCLRMLEKDPIDRPGSAREVIEELRGARRRSARKRSEAVEHGWVDSDIRCFTGRADELAIIESLLAASEPGFAVIEGEPGVGKSALLAEIASKGSALDYAVWRGTVLENSGFPLKPLLDCLLGNRSELEAAVPGMGDLIDTVAGGATGGDFEVTLYRLACELLRFAKTRPLLLIIDDIHWADGPTIRLLDHLQSLLHSSGSGDAALIAIAATRPLTSDSDRHRTIRSWASAVTTTWISVQAFADLDTGALISELTGLSPTRRLLRLVQQATGGNPLFIRELLLHLDTSGSLGERGGALSTDAHFDDVDLPKSLKSAISLMLGKLSEEVTSIVRVASCLGLDFDVGLLCSTARLPREVVLDRLAEVEKVGLIEGRGERYTFRHPLFRRSLYDSMPNAERLRIHGDVARTLLATIRDDGPALVDLANHAALAFDFAGEDLTVDLMIRASWAAIGRLSWDHAIRFCEAVLDRAESLLEITDAQRMDLHRLAASAYHQVGEVVQAQAHFGRCADLARAAGDTRRLAWVLQEQVRMETNFGKAGLAAAPQVAELESLIDQLSDRETHLRGRLMGTIANSLVAANQLEGAELWARRARELARSSGDDGLLARAGGELALIQWELLELSPSLDSWREARLAAQRAGDQAMEARCLQRIPHVLLLLGLPDEVDAGVDAARDASSPIHRTGELTVSLVAAMTVALARGDLDRARGVAEEGQDLMNESGYSGTADLLLAGVAYTAAMLGDWRGAVESIELLVEPGAVLDEPDPMRKVAARYLRLVRVLRGEKDQVREELLRDPPRSPPTGITLRRSLSYCLAVETAWEVGEWEWSGAPNCLRALQMISDKGVILLPGWPFLVPRIAGCAAAMAGDGEAAEAYLHRALALGEELGMSAELGRAHFNLARFYDLTSAGHSAGSTGSTGSVDEIESHCRAAERIFEACGMVPCLDAVVHMRLGRS